MLSRLPMPVLCIVALVSGCFLSPPPVAPDIGRALDGPVVVMPCFVAGGERMPLRSLLAWPDKPVQVGLPSGRVVALEVIPASEGVLLRDATSGREVSGGYDVPVSLSLEGGVLEVVVEYP